MKSRIWNTLLLLCMVSALVVAPGCAGLAQGMKNLGQQLEATKPLLQQAGETGTAVIENGKKIIENGERIVGELSEMEKQAKQQADADKSGKIDSMSEWLTYIALLAGGGGTILGGGKVLAANRKRNAEEIAKAVKDAQ